MANQKKESIYFFFNLVQKFGFSYRKDSDSIISISSGNIGEKILKKIVLMRGGKKHFFKTRARINILKLIDKEF